MKTLAAVAVTAVLVVTPATPTSPAAAPEAVVAAAAGATTLYVSPTGDDAATGTGAAPLRTIQLAVDRLPAAGGKVLLRGGSYAQRVTIARRTGVTLAPVAGATPVLDATGLTPPNGRSAVVRVTGGSGITVRGLAITGYRTTSLAKVPIGILVEDGAQDVSLVANHVHHLGNDNGTRGSFDINAHGIAVYGDNPTTPISGLVVSDNEVDHLVLGASEAVVVNGNVDGWQVLRNRVHDVNNIAIDAIGYEDQTFGADSPLRYTDTNRARNGVISGNVVTNVVSRGNPSYWEGGWCNCADGLYVDGGRSIAVDANTVSAADIGIEVAAEDPLGHTNAISVTNNTVTGSRWVGLAVGGYDPVTTGDAYDITVTGNTLRGNNTLRDGSPEILLQYKVHATTITGNRVTATNAGYPLLVQRVARAGTAAQNTGVVLDHNDYGTPVAAADVPWIWFDVERYGFSTWQARTGQDAHSTYTRR